MGEFGRALGSRGGDGEGFVVGPCMVSGGPWGEGGSLGWIFVSLCVFVVGIVLLRA